MKTTTNVETTLTVNLSPQDVLKIIADYKIVPPDWKYYSFDLKGEGISKGAILTIKCTQKGHSIPKT